MSKTLLFQTIQFSISKKFISVWPIDRTLSCAITPKQSGLGSDGNKGVLCIPQSSSITGTSPLDCLVSYTGHSFRGVLPLCREAVGVFYNRNRLGWHLPNFADTTDLLFTRIRCCRRAMQGVICIAKTKMSITSTWL